MDDLHAYLGRSNEGFHGEGIVGVGVSNTIGRFVIRCNERLGVKVIDGVVDESSYGPSVGVVNGSIGMFVNRTSKEKDKGPIIDMNDDKNIERGQVEKFIVLENNFEFTNSKD